MAEATKTAAPAQPTPLDLAKQPGAPLTPETEEGSQREHEDRSGRDLIGAVANPGKSLSETEKISATDWFLTDEPDDQQELTHTFEINVGSADSERWIEWTIRAVDMDTLRRIRRQAQGSRASRRAGSGEIDEVAANTKIVVEGTVSPNLREIAQAKGVGDPGVVLHHRFQRKPGLLGQIAGEIMSLSGYDDEDLREIQAGKG